MRCNRTGGLCVAFALGLIAASCFPYTLMIVIIAAVVILLGLSLCRYY